MPPIDKNDVRALTKLKLALMKKFGDDYDKLDISRIFERCLEDANTTEELEACVEDKLKHKPQVKRLVKQRPPPSR